MRKNIKRLQFDFSRESLVRLDRLVEKPDSSSRAEVVRNSLRVSEYFTSMSKAGYSLRLEKEDDKIQMIIP